MKAFTDLEQSKKLAEILPLESADMEYMFLKGDGGKVTNVPFVKDDEEPEWPSDSAYDFIPCWSLAALLDVLPDEADIVKGKVDVGDYKYMCTVCIKEEVIIAFGNNLVDTCVDIIIKLHKRKLL